MKHPIRAAILAASAALGLSGCVTDDGYGYSGVSLGYGTGYYGDPYWGWYDDFYYPGTGYYIYDRGGARHRWSDSHRRYWEGRRGNRPYRENWSGFRRDNNPNWQQRREAWRSRGAQSGQQPNGEASRQAWQQRREAWQAQRQQQGSEAGRQSWQQRREAWQARRQQQGETATTPSWRQRGNDWNAQRPQSDGSPSWRGRGRRDRD